ncbi:thump domain containing protein [Sporothrix brasiliensis 5110]|uniref:Thump domain containing protein n=1 Tax=Sporothrix brasiliensis 5110 TaxID=1398154 RepID=A0A0C2FDA1_9PEZI|nr:thump domain containing protein [Sporothrix brasiliensis 5110]KIH89108.1 thump domain containing protein [Sporothrix brasiliensis 5110]
MSNSTKRKSPPNAGTSAKRKKAGNHGKWTTSHQKVKSLNVERGSVEPGDVGIWVTCARNMESRAAREMIDLFDKQYAKNMYGIPIPGEEGAETGTVSGEDVSNGSNEAKSGGGDEIEDLVQREIASLRTPSKNKSHYFTQIRLNVECLLFSKTVPPIDPVAMAHQISVDVKRDAEIAAVAMDEAIEKGTAVPMTRSFRYLNRLTPITASGRATEKGVRHVALEVLSPWFKLSLQPANCLGEKDNDDSTSPIYTALKKMQGTAENKPDYTLKNKEPQDLAKVTGTITTTGEGGDTVTIGPTEGEK